SLLRVGRSSDNEIVLPDYSVSRRHAGIERDGDGWVVRDLDSTNGVQVNGQAVERAAIRPGDIVKVGVFELSVEAEPVAPPPPPPPDRVGAPGSGTFPSPAAPLPSPQQTLSNATIIRPLADFSDELGFQDAWSTTAIRRNKRKALDEAYASQVFGFLTRLARLLIQADDVDAVLEGVMEIAFDALPVDRGFLLLRDDVTDDLECALMRINENVERWPSKEIPVSATMLRAVMQEKVALLTYDALSDQRLAGTESVRIHQIRAAMCAPLWSADRVIGVMQVDSPHHTGSFTEQDVDFLTALSNYCAVAIERLENARRAEEERQVRGQLERYHSPAVIEDMLHGGAGARRLKAADVTVMFADLVGFTAFSEKSEPEQVAELMEGFFSHAVEAIFTFGGTLDKFIGDCVMAFFGAPVAQGDHAPRAVRASVRILEALDEWNRQREQAGEPRIEARISLNSGPVVVGDIGSKRRVDYTVLGNTVNVAARLEKIAQPGDIVMGEETHRLAGAEWPSAALGDFDLKGLSERTRVFRVLRAPTR
ncbi:MAG: adenylate/guanylate cyclase domain-containing protein, partial [Acidobacteriota bacterium]